MKRYIHLPELYMDSSELKRYLKEMYDFELKEIEYAEGGDTMNLDNSEKIHNFTQQTTKNDIQDVISGKSKVRNGAAIQAAASYLRTIKSASSKIENPKLYKKQEENLLKTYAAENNLWVSSTYLEKYVDEGAEQKVYFLGQNSVIKLSNAIFYDFWEDYFNSLLLHNYFFPDTAYELVGFMEKDNTFYAVIKQPLVSTKEKTDLDKVKKEMSENGFVNTKNNDYYNENLVIILEDLHEENVLTKDGILRYIDTVFYLQAKKHKLGGLLKEFNKKYSLNDLF